MSAKAVCVKLALLLLASVWLVGCVQTKTTPGYAKAGDHIIIGLGGTVRNAGGASVLKPSDLTIVLKDANNQQFTLESRYIFKSYLDYSALMNTYTFDGTTASMGLVGMVPYDGGWFVLAPLTYPGQYSSPLPLAAGAATISVTSPKLTNTANSVEGNLTAIPIDILPGTSAQDANFVRQFVGYTESTNSFFIKPSSLTGVTDIGGAFLAINYNDDTFFKSGLKPVVVPATHNPYVQLNYNVVPNGGGTGTIYITLLNPAGFKTLATAAPNSSLQSDLAVRLNYFSNGTPAQAKANFSVDSVKSHYIRTDGSTIYGVYPVLTHVVDL
jgi:hypothetical protein